MTVPEGMLIAIIVLVFVFCMIALKGFIREGFFHTRRNIYFALAFGLLFMSYLFYNLVLQKIGPSDWVQIFLVLGLVAVTGFYALSAARQADASVKMADEMRDQTLALYKPKFVLEKRSSTKGKYFVKEIGIDVGNVQGGSAINLELYIAHPLFKFNKSRYPFSISVGQNPVDLGLKVEEPSVDDDPGVPIEPLALVVANYEDTSGNPWHSTLELIWDATTKNIKLGYMRVAVSGHHNIGDNGDD